MLKNRSFTIWIFLHIGAVLFMVRLVETMRIRNQRADNSRTSDTSVKDESRRVVAPEDLEVSEEDYDRETSFILNASKLLVVVGIAFWLLRLAYPPHLRL